MSPLILDIVFTDLSDFGGDILLVEEEAIFSNLQGGVLLLLEFHNSLEIFPVGLGLVEGLADLGMGVWVVLFDHLNEEAKEFIDGLDDSFTTLLNKGFFHGLISLVEVLNSDWLVMETVVQVDFVKLANFGSSKESSRELSTNLLKVFSLWIILDLLLWGNQVVEDDNFFSFLFLNLGFWLWLLAFNDDNFWGLFSWFLWLLMMLRSMVLGSGVMVFLLAMMVAFLVFWIMMFSMMSWSMCVVAAVVLIMIYMMILLNSFEISGFASATSATTSLATFIPATSTSLSSPAL